MDRFTRLFKRANSVIIGMVHLKALPGSPAYAASISEIVDSACREATVFEQAGMDGIIIENMNDMPWLRPHEIGPETTAAMAVIASAVRREVPLLPIGVQMLCAANKEALSVAKAAGLNFVRAEGFVFSHIGDEGPVHSCAAELLRYRRHLEAENIMIFTDIKKKHSAHAITSDVSIEDTAHAAELFRSDGIIVTGAYTGKETDVTELKAVQQSTSLPVMVGSGVTEENVHHYMSTNAIIIGSHLKKHGQTLNDLDIIRVQNFMEKVRKLREHDD